jgi:CubicO group peptidase (beta-lactamase class C family)
MEIHLGEPMNCFGIRASRVLVLAPFVGSLLLFPLLPNVKKETTTLSRATIDQLEKDIPEQMKKNGVPGLAMAVIGGGKTTWVHGFG